MNAKPRPRPSRFLPQSAISATRSTTLRPRGVFLRSSSRKATGSMPRLAAISSRKASGTTVLAGKPMPHAGVAVELIRGLMRDVVASQLHAAHEDVVLAAGLLEAHRVHIGRDAIARDPVVPC